MFIHVTTRDHMGVDRPSVYLPPPNSTLLSMLGWVMGGCGPNEKPQIDQLLGVLSGGNGEIRTLEEV